MYLAFQDKNKHKQVRSKVADIIGGVKNDGSGAIGNAQEA